MGAHYESRPFASILLIALRKFATTKRANAIRVQPPTPNSWPSTMQCKVAAVLLGRLLPVGQLHIHILSKEAATAAVKTRYVCKSNGGSKLARIVNRMVLMRAVQVCLCSRSRRRRVLRSGCTSLYLENAVAAHQCDYLQVAHLGRVTHKRTAQHLWSFATSCRRAFNAVCVCASEHRLRTFRVRNKQKKQSTHTHTQPTKTSHATEDREQMHKGI